MRAGGSHADSSGMTTLRRSLLMAAAGALAGVLAAVPAFGSQIVDRNASNVSLQVNYGRTALVSYQSGGAAHHVLFWGGVDWAGHFARDYSGGWGSKRANWKHFRNACRPYTGPALPMVVAACDAPDGSYWALQKWARLWPDYGGRQAPTELHLSHWTGDLGVLSIHSDWGYHGRWQHLFGTFSYHGRGVYGTRWTRQGVPLDLQGRNVYVDSFKDGVWSRVNSFLTHSTTGGFCYLFSPHQGQTGTGQSYRATVIGPGVSPIVRTSFAPPPAFNSSTDAQARRQLEAMLGSHPDYCRGAD